MTAHNPLQIVVLAAGQGKRMRSALPKVLQPLASRPLLTHVLDTAAALSPERTVVVYGHGGAAVREAMSARDVAWAEQAEQNGTGHAVQQALPELSDSGRVLVLLGDVPLLQAQTLRDLLDETPEDGVGVLSVRVADPSGYGRIVRDAAGGVQAIVEHRDATAEQHQIDEINTGVFVLPAAQLTGWLGRITPHNAQGEYYLTDVIGLAVADGAPVSATACADAEEVMGINDRVHLAQAERAWQRRTVDALMRAGARVADPARVDIRGDVTVAEDVFIDVNVVLEGKVSLGAGSVVGPNCVLINANIGAGTTLFANTYIEDSRVGARCNLGPFARLRPGADFRDGSKAGNFVEVKKSVIGEGSKVNHLSYVGDSVLGQRVNVGAGTITCNYDGANKHQTIIGDDAFIGSGVELIAPVEVGRGATIGAGSTISKPAAADALTLERARQRTIEGWQRPVKKK
ncbi:MAG: bifunctional UDP-N-acetylglucosamine diphosphorylase/glucosamine-1-phosphate N-acetyltransferase GlmU [Pseudomonadota bacterium]